MARDWVLVVDDDPVVLGLLSEWLEARGFRVTTTTDALQAFIQARDLKPILILCDIMMPAWGTGFDGLRRLREARETKDVPVVFVTGLPPDEARKIALLDSKTRLLFKPVQWPLLAAAIRELTGREVKEPEKKPES